MTKQKIFFVTATFSIAIVFLIFTFIRRYLALDQASSIITTPTVISNEPSAELKLQTPVPPLKLEVIAENLYVPWSMVFTSTNRILLTERSGNIRTILNNKLQTEPVLTFPEVDSAGEEGLMGLALDPEYQRNKLLYVCLAYPTNNQLTAKVLQLKDNGLKLSIERTVIDNIPAARFHAGCELGFGPDSKLYISTGDATDKNIAQDLSSTGGKLLRINTDGSIPDDNPFPNSAIWSYGHRNPQGLDWHPISKQLFSTEHGPSVFDGPAGGDEINIISKAGNYGWPKVSHEQIAQGMINPLLVFTPAIAPGSAHFYTGSTIPTLQNDLLVGMLKGEGILRVVLTAPGYDKVALYQKLDGIDVGRIREITTGPDGAIYFSTSNRDGRGETRPNDDKIYRIIP